MNKIFLILTLFFIIGSSKGQIKSEEFFSNNLQDNRKIAIYTPNNYDKNLKYPLIVVLDAESLLEPVIANVRYFNYFKTMPESIIVGVYNTKEDTSIDKEYGLPVDQSLSFMSFLEEELTSYIKKNYSISSLQIITASGKSANYINYFLLKQQPAFNAYISLTPDLIQKISPNIAENIGTAPKKIFYYMATTDLMYKEAYDIAKELNTLIEKTDKTKVDYYFEDFIGASENSVVLTGIPRAFDLLFDIYKPISVKEFREVIMEKEGGFFEYLTEKYDNIKNNLGIDKKISINDIMAIYSAIRKKGDWESLNQLANLVKSEYKDTAMPEFFYGEYYERIGEPKKSLRAYQRAYTRDDIDFITKEVILEKINSLKEDFGFK